MSKAPRIIELVGPPGSGKSTLAEILRKNNDTISIVTAPNFRDIKYLTFFVTSLLRLIPNLLRLFFSNQGRWFPSKRDIAVMTILTGWNLALLKSASSSSNLMIVLEEGAICLLAKLHGFSSNLLQDDCTHEWWQKMYETWARTLDMVVVLDTSIPVLLKRIRSRELQFEIGAMPDTEAGEYLRSIQAAEDHILAHLMAQPNSPELFRLSTLEKSPQQIYAEVIRALQNSDSVAAAHQFTG